MDQAEFNENLPLEHYLSISGISSERPITYRRSHRAICGSVTGAILLQQIAFWSDNKKGEPFYKFKQPCNHPLYEEGDSWCEELGFSRHEFDGAIKKIGKKTKQAEMELDGVTLVYYWTDRDRVTWYWLDRVALGKAAFRLYVERFNGFSKSQKAAFLHTKNTHRSLSEKDTHTPPDQDAVHSMIATLSDVAKETYYHGNQLEFEDAAYLMIGWDADHEKVKQFGELWAEHGHYFGKPALKSIINEFENFLNGIWPNVPQEKPQQPAANGKANGQSRYQKLFSEGNS